MEQRVRATKGPTMNRAQMVGLQLEFKARAIAHAFALLDTRARIVIQLSLALQGQNTQYAKMVATTLVLLAAVRARAPQDTPGIIVKFQSYVLLERMGSRAKMAGPQRGTVMRAVASAKQILLGSIVKQRKDTKLKPEALSSMRKREILK